MTQRQNVGVLAYRPCQLLPGGCGDEINGCMGMYNSYEPWTPSGNIPEFYDAFCD